MQNLFPTPEAQHSPVTIEIGRVQGAFGFAPQHWSSASEPPLQSPQISQPSGQAALSQPQLSPVPRHTPQTSQSASPGVHVPSPPHTPQSSTGVETHAPLTQVSSHPSPSSQSTFAEHATHSSATQKGSGAAQPVFSQTPALHSSVVHPSPSSQSAFAEHATH